MKRHHVFRRALRPRCAAAVEADRPRAGAPEDLLPQRNTTVNHSGKYQDNSGKQSVVTTSVS
jgi:hypothetical protein